MVARAGAGPTPIPFKQLTAESLARAITEALSPETLERARGLGERIKEERGCEIGAASFHAQMDVDRLRCLMSPSRPAVWRIETKGKETQDIRLSAFAATVLGNEGFLDVNQLRLHRPCEYPVEYGKLSSHLSGPNPVLSTAGSIASEVVHWPVHIAKAWGGLVYEPFKGARRGGWAGFGKGLGRGVGHFIFGRRSLVIGSTKYGVRVIYEAIRKQMGAGTLSFILAAHFAKGFEEVKASTEEERQEVLVAWQQLAPDLKLTKSSTNSSTSSSVVSLSRNTTLSSSKADKASTSDTTIPSEASSPTKPPGTGT